MQIVDLRQLSSWQLDPLLAEERSSGARTCAGITAARRTDQEVRRRPSLTGSAILENGRPVGYAFYVLEDHKGLVGGLFVSPRYSQQELSQRLLTDTLTTLSGIPKLERVEAQLIPFGYALDPVLSEYGFRLYTRQFMIAPLTPNSGEALDVLPGLIREKAPAPGCSWSDGTIATSSLRPADTARLRQSCRRRNQRSIPQRIGRAALPEKHHHSARLRPVSAGGVVRPARAARNHLVGVVKIRAFPTASATPRKSAPCPATRATAWHPPDGSVAAGHARAPSPPSPSR